MGQKVHPTGLRLGIVKKHKSTWYAGMKTFAQKLKNDFDVRNFLRKKLSNASVSKIEIERPSGNAPRVVIHTARPGVVIGRKGEDVEKLREALSKQMNAPAQIDVEEIKKPELDAQLVADSIAQQLEKRLNFRRVMKRATQNAMRAGAEGIKVKMSGRLAGAEIARAEWHREGRVPLHTLRADIDYATSEALTTYGLIGIKIWIFKGEVLPAGQEQVVPKPSSKKKKGAK